MPRDQMLEGFTKLVEGPRLDDLLNALVSSGEHPALQHSCLMVMCGVASLKAAHDLITKRRDVLKALLSALASPKPHRISPEGAEEDLDVNPAVGAAICLNRFVDRQIPAEYLLYEGLKAQLLVRLQYFLGPGLDSVL